jgi:hypothetical protein
VTEQSRPLVTDGAGSPQARYEMSNSRPQPANLADVLERILDKGIVIAGDIKVDLLDIELLTIKIRLLVASVDKAKEMGIDWWENDPMLSTRSRDQELEDENRRLKEQLLEDENRRLKERLQELEAGS